MKTPFEEYLDFRNHRNCSHRQLIHLGKSGRFSVGATTVRRLQCFPRGLGKGHDCALLSKWLKSILDELHPSQVPDSWKFC